MGKTPPLPALGCKNTVATHAGEAQQAQQGFLVIGRAFGSCLYFCNLAAFDQHEIGIGVGA